MPINDRVQALDLIGILALKYLIMENTIKYYNNRPVLVLKKHEQIDFYQVFVKIEIEGKDLDQIAESFRGCDACMVGHKSTCYCDDRVNNANDILEEIFQQNEITEENLFWVKAKDLKDIPFEWRENEKLKSQIASNKNILNGLIDIVAENKSLIKIQEKQLQDNSQEIIKYDRIVENRKSLTDIVIKDYDKLIQDIKNLEDSKKVMIEGEEISISGEEYSNLLKRDELLSALEAGGVDNWEWYSESTKNLEQ